MGTKITTANIIKITFCMPKPFQTLDNCENTMYYMTVAVQLYHIETSLSIEFLG